jgi:hypothetical protein
MAHEKKTSPFSKCFLSIRVNAEQKALVVQAAEREGLQISSFIIMLLVRLRILPDRCLKKIKRCPVPHFNELHGLLGVVNKIGGNCKQLAVFYPDHAGLSRAHAQIIQAAAIITDALRGKKVPEGVNLYQLQGDLTREGYVFNQIVKSVNIGRPNLAGLQDALAAIGNGANAITAALSGLPVRAVVAPEHKSIKPSPEAVLRKATMKKRLTGMWKVASKEAKHRKGRK